MTEKWQKFAKLRVILPSIVLAIGAIFGLIKAFEYLRYSMKHVTTDDARVKGRMVSVAPEVSGIVKVLRVDEGSVVKVGDILLELNDTTYRLLEEAQAQAEMIERQFQEDKRSMPSTSGAPRISSSRHALSWWRNRAPSPRSVRHWCWK